MHKGNNETVLVRKTAKLDQRKLNRIAHRYGLAPIDVRELQQGFNVRIPQAMANELDKDGFVRFIPKHSVLRSYSERMGIVTPELEESTTTTDISDTVAILPEETENNDPQDSEELES